MAKHPKYINPATDFGFKKIFKDEEITRGFLNALMKKYNPEIHIAKVDITDGEADDSNKNSRRVVYDVHCVTDTEEEFIIEMQNDSQEFFAERIVYYLARSASRQQEKGLVEYTDENGEIKKKPWDYRLKNIYGVFFMNFKDDKNPKGLTHIALCDTETQGKIDSEVFQYWKIQMPFYKKMKESDCKDDIDKWIYNLSNMPTMKTNLAFANEEPLFRRLENIATYSALTREQQIQYDDSFNNYLAYIGQMHYNLRKGEEKGREEGEKKGRAEEKIDIARKLKAANLDINFIAQTTGLSIDEINTL